MPAKKPTTRRQVKAVQDIKQTSRNKKTTKGWLPALIISTIVVGIIFILVVIGLNQWTKRGVSMVEQTNMSKFLKEKYGQEFLVSNLHLEGSGFGEKGDVVGDASSTSNPSLQFEVSQREDSNDPSYNDNFLDVLWSQQGRSAVDDLIKRELSNVEDYTLTIRVGNALRESIHGNTPSFDDALKKYPGQYSYSLTVRSATNASDSEPTDSELNRAFKVVQFVKQQHAGTPEAYYLYKHADFHEVDNTGKKLFQYSIAAQGEELNAIQSPEALRNYFKQLR
jgi:hypothetical protein